MKEYQYRFTKVRAVEFDGDVEGADLVLLMGAQIVMLNYVCQDVAVLCTKEGPKAVNVGDFIVRLPNGEFRAYPPEAFAQEFEETAE